LLRTSDLLTVAAVAASGASSAAVDLWTRRVPNALTFTTAAAGLGLAWAGLTGVSIWMALGGLALGLALMLPGHVIGATGAGDVKLFAALGTFLGPAGTGMAFLYTALAGGVLAVLVSVKRRRTREMISEAATLVLTAGANVGRIERPSSNNRFAYAPAIAIGAMVAALGL
jgi:prepilin peptidase CpaA